MTNKTEDKFYFGNIGTKAESELTVRITKMLGEVERAVLSRNQEKAKSIASKVREMIRKSANTSTAKMQMDELNSIMLGVSFSRKGKSERFGMAEQVMRDGSVHLDFSAARDYLAKQSDEGLRYIIKDAKSARDAMGTAGRKFHYYTDLVLEAQQELKKRGFSRPGQPERFAASGWQTIEAYVQVLAEEFGTPRGKEAAQVMLRAAESLGGSAPAALRTAIRTAATSKNVTDRGRAIGQIEDMIESASFSRPGQPERFGLEDACWEGYEPVGTKQKDGRTVPNCVPKDKNEQPEEFAEKQRSAIQVTDAEYAALVAADAEMEQWVKYQYDQTPQQKAIRDAGKAAMASALARLNAAHKKWEAASSDAERAQIENQYGNSGRPYKSKHFSRPGEKDKFSNGDRNRRLMQVLADADRQIANKVVSNIAKNYGIGTLQVFAEIFDSEAEDLMDYVTEPVRSSAFAILQKKGMMSRPGQPERFDASSLDRGNFAEASKSPMLGKLLSEKAMPDGGWRAVQVGSDTLVISFEDADLARDFGRRAASKGYSATSPVATTGRYWNVEVKNGK